jgi:hypothetical protein
MRLAQSHTPYQPRDTREGHQGMGATIRSYQRVGDNLSKCLAGLYCALCGDVASDTRELLDDRTGE